MMDLKIFVDLDNDLRLARRVYRDIIERGREMETIVKRYHQFVKPAYSQYIYPTKKFADILIPKGAENTLAVDLICTFLQNEIGNKFPYYTFEGNLGKRKKSHNSFFDTNQIFNDDSKLFISSNKTSDTIIKKCLLIGPQNIEDRKNLRLSLKYICERRNKNYIQLYIEIICENLVKLIPIEIFKNYFLLYNSNDFRKIKQIIGKRNLNENILIFYPFYISENNQITELIKLIEENESKVKIYIIAIFFNKLLIREYFTKYKKLVHIFAIFYSDIWNEIKQLPFFLNSRGKILNDEYEFNQETFESAFDIELNKILK